MLLIYLKSLKRELIKIEPFSLSGKAVEKGKTWHAISLVVSQQAELIILEFVGVSSILVSVCFFLFLL